MDRSSWMPNSWVKHTEITIPMGHSRYGGPIIDMPPHVARPVDLEFVAQINLGEFSKFDKKDLLPKTGQLIVFADIRKDKGLVIYTDTSSEQLVRHIHEHESDFFAGILVGNIRNNSECLRDRLTHSEGGCYSFVSDDGLVWDDFAGSETSKIFGIPTHCQWPFSIVKEKIDDDFIVLLQFGENGFNDEGVFSVLIKREHLKNRDFSSCEFHWAQT
ncbi:MAG: DUF1963 domain-containing protein [Pseudobacteriovorax sp.]|nr:DUF1963 domain-containing protein [Pseudobacteriovorax sp.]